MRWGVAFRALCVIAAVVCGASRASAQDADVNAIDSEAYSPSAVQSWWAALTASSSIEMLPSFEGIPLLEAPLPLAFDMLRGGAKPDQFLFYAGFDIWRFGLAGYGGMQWAPGKQNDDGFILRVFASDGVERYSAGTKAFSTQIFRAAVLPGWQFKRGSFLLQVFAGPDTEIHVLTPDILSAKLRGLHFGARVAVDAWWEPTSKTMLAASASTTTIGTSYSARGAAGVRLFDRFWTGPEIATSADEFSRQYRVGAHLTGFRTADIEWSAAAGYLTDSFNRSGAYGRIGVAVRQ